MSLPRGERLLVKLIWLVLGIALVQVAVRTLTLSTSPAPTKAPAR